MRIQRLLLAALTVLALATPWLAAADDTAPPPDPDLGTDIVSAAAVDGQLWALGSPHSEKAIGGSLVSFALADGTRHLRAEHVVGLQKTDGHLFVLDVPDGHVSRLREWKGTELVPIEPALKLDPRDKVLSLFDAGGHPGVETKKGTFMLGDSGWRALELYGPPPPGAFSADVFGPSMTVHGLPSSGTAIYSGFNQGEWGGGFDWEDIATGKGASLADKRQNATGREAIYDGGLDPVNGIIADPFNKDCVIAAIGLIHFEASGRLLRACGGALSVVLDPFACSPASNGKPFCTEQEAFFGLVPEKTGYWAVSNRAIYRFGASATPERFTFTKFEPWHGLWVNREAPGALVLITEINRRFSVNNGTPLIVPLD